MLLCPLTYIILAIVVDWQCDQEAEGWLLMENTTECKVDMVMKKPEASSKVARESHTMGKQP